ncbi:MAG TPA: HEAT repeat domain-containing protein [Nitrospira sp.]|nr:HEAT repeat domain-containing protein [Nitrospira sp.]
MAERGARGQANLTSIIVLVGLLVAGVWIWKKLPPDTQDYVVDQIVPVAAGGAVIGSILLVVTRNITRRAARRRERDRLITAFQRETNPSKKLDLSFALMEGNAYRTEGLDTVGPDLKDLWGTTLQQAVGDEQHRIRGMAASHLGALQDQSVVPLLLKALEDDHPYVRACAALGLGRLRAKDARERLARLANDDGDQTVRGRAREALERLET